MELHYIRFRFVGVVTEDTLGIGNVNLVLLAAIDGNAQWLCVEQDEPNEGLTRLQGVAKSVEYLKSLDLM